MSKRFCRARSRDLCDSVLPRRLQLLRSFPFLLKLPGKIDIMLHATSELSEAQFTLNPTSLPSLIQTTHNIQFNPKPSLSGRCAKLRLSLLLDSTVFVAGGTLDGRIEITCLSATKVRLGKIAIELTGFEGKHVVSHQCTYDFSKTVLEVNHGDTLHSQSFLVSEIIIQGARKPPSTAVVGPSVSGFWQGIKKKSVFGFSFNLPLDSPSSFSFQSLASLKYVITAYFFYLLV